MEAPGERWRERAAIVALASVSLATSVLLDVGLVCSNDGSHYALIKALADDGSAVIDEYVPYTHEVDFARMGEHYYSDRPPGTAFLALPFYFAARAASLDDVGRQKTVVGLAMIAGAWTIVVLFQLMRLLGATRVAAFAAALAVALCTPLRSYSATLFSHALSAALVTTLAFLAIPREGAAPRARRRAHIAGGVLGGYACGVDYTNGLPVALLCVIAALVEGRGDRRASLRIAATYLAGGVVGALPALAYHTVVFGAPWSIAYHYDVNFEFAHTVGGLYSGSFFEGVLGLFASPRAGLLFWSPIMIATLAAIPTFVREHRGASAMLLLPFVAAYLLASKVILWDAGATRDVRYVMSVLPLLSVPLAWAFDWAFGTRFIGRAGANDEAPRLRPGWLAAIFGLFFVSAAMQAVKHHAIWARDGSRWISAIAQNLETDVGPTLAAFAAWAWPHPIAALVVLATGLGVASALRTKGLREAKQALAARNAV